MAHIAQYKKETVNDFVALMEKYPIIGVVNMENLPSPQLQKMRSQLRGKMELRMTKRRLLKLAVAQLKDKKPGIEKLLGYMGGMPAILFTKDNPFALARTLQQNKSKAPAKPGQIAPNDVVIEPGKTPFTPGPVISELSQAGLKTGVEEGKVTIKERKVIVKAGEVIKPNIASLLTKLSILPMEIGLDLVAVLEKGCIYPKSVLNIDIKEFLANLSSAASSAFNLAMDCAYPTKENADDLLALAHGDARALAIGQGIYEKDVIEVILATAHAQMMGVKAEANL
ncbi:50S ribosomal protein L10 [Candidatus Woesearchaeota archaeon]|nr:50S ribosomal protein L10 [Candidatus Woesearchaeota archaeon]